MKIFIISISIALGIIAALVAALMSTKVNPIEIEGSDTSMITQLQDAGYGSGGIL